MSFSIILMIKDEMGIMEKELGVYNINDEYSSLISEFYAKRIPDEEMEDGKGNYNCHMMLTTDRDLSDWEFNAVYDYYNEQVFTNENVTFKEMDSFYNPTWELTFPFIENESELESNINNFIQIHLGELISIYEAIKDKESDYTDCNNSREEGGVGI